MGGGRGGEGEREREGCAGRGREECMDVWVRKETQNKPRVKMTSLKPHTI